MRVSGHDEFVRTASEEPELLGFDETACFVVRGLFGIGYHSLTNEFRIERTVFIALA